jgi:serine/threonine protein kinase
MSEVVDTPSGPDSGSNSSVAPDSKGETEPSSGHVDTVPSSKQEAVDVASTDDDGAAAGIVLDFGKHGAFTLERRLGRGAIGEVYKAKQVGTAGFTQSVAIKLLRPDPHRKSEQSFIDEARILSMLHHESIARIYNFFEWNGTHVLVMEYIEGRTLWSLLELAKRKGRQLSEDVTCEIISEVADALNYAHAAKDDQGRPLRIVHRDVTPTNILITETGRTKLVDFGVAWSTMEGRKETSSPFPFKGKLPYLSPEQVEKRPLDGRSDLCALGSILVEMLTGRSPFADDVPYATLKLIAKVTPEYVDAVTPGVSRRMKAICKKLLAREPSKRFANGQEVAEALREYAGRYHGPTRVRREVADLEALPDVSEPLLQPPFNPARQAKSRWGALMAALVLVGVAYFSAFFSGGIPSSQSAGSMPPKAQTAPASLPQHKPLMPQPSQTEKLAIAYAKGSTTVNEEKKPEPRGAAAKAAGETRSRAVPRFPTANTCGRALVAAATATTLTVGAACPGYVRTGTETGDCAGTTVREVDGRKLPDYFIVRFVDLKGVECQGKPFLGLKTEPCPAGNGHIVVKASDNGEGFGSPMLFGRAYVVNGRETLHEVRSQPREAIGRMAAVFTEMRLTDGTTVPVCGILYSDPDNHGGKEGIPILDDRYYGSWWSGKMTAPTWGRAKVKFYWPP